MPLLSCLLVAGLAASTSGCVSTVTIRSEPSRANVYRIDEYGRAELLGQTPAPVDVENGCFGPATRVVVVDGDEAMEITLMRGQVTPASLSNAVATAGTNMLCCGACAAGAAGAGWALAPFAPFLAVPGFCIAGCAGATALCQLAWMPAQMWAPPERVTVDLEHSTVHTEPAYLVLNVKRFHDALDPAGSAGDDDEEGAEQGDGEGDDDESAQPGDTVEILFVPY